MNKKQIKEFEARIQRAIEEAGTDETPEIERMLQEVTGPGVGLIYNPETRKLRLANGWIFDNDGNVVRLDDVTGPGTGMIYRDGKLVKAD